MPTLTDWKGRYHRAGLAAIPIPSGAKAPPVVGKDWPDIAPATQWQTAGAGFRGNLALMCGGGLVVIDCDAPSTEQAVTGWRDGLGIDTATVQTPSGGAHLYMHCDDVPDTFKWAKLALGPGELRARRAYVVAPPSAVDGRRYRFTHGQPERLATVRWHDLATLLAKDVTETAPLDVPPVPLVHRDMNAKVHDLLRELCDLPAHILIPGGKSRSELEAQAVTGLILAGWPFDDILAVFEQHRPGHYKECGERRTDYLERTYRNVLGWLAVQGERLAIAETYQLAAAMPWPGRTGLHDRAVYLALLGIAWQHASTQVYASERDLALASAKSRKGVQNALHRLSEAGLIQRMGADGTHGTAQWRVLCAKVAISHSRGSIHNTGGTGRGGNAEAEQSTGAPEVWGWYGLGRSAGAVYAALGDDPTDPAALEARTGKSRWTVTRALATLAQHGLAERDGDGWQRGPVTLADVALEMDAKGKHDARRRQIEHERDNWRRLREAAHKRDS